jgi:hypothetical protein
MESKMNTISKLVLVGLTCVFLQACGGGGPGGSGNDSATLTWTPPTQNNDNSPLSPGEIASYRIYYGEDQLSLIDFIEIDASIYPNSYTINYDASSIPNHTNYYLAMTTVNTQGIESVMSNVISLNTN